MQHSDTDIFLMLLVKYHDGYATREEAAYIKHQLTKHGIARELWQDVQDCFAGEHKVKKCRIKSWVYRINWLFSGSNAYWMEAIAVILLTIAIDTAYMAMRPSKFTAHKEEKNPTVYLRLSKSNQ